MTTILPRRAFLLGFGGLGLVFWQRGHAWVEPFEESGREEAIDRVAVAAERGGGGTGGGGGATGVLASGGGQCQHGGGVCGLERVVPAGLAAWEGAGHRSERHRPRGVAACGRPHRGAGADPLGLPELADGVDPAPVVVPWWRIFPIQLASRSMLRIPGVAFSWLRDVVLALGWGASGTIGSASSISHRPCMPTGGLTALGRRGSGT